MSLTRAFLAAACLSAAAGRAEALKGENVTPADDHPEAVLIRASGGGRGAEGTGALIHPRVVLTAAHVVKGFDRFEVTAPHLPGGAARAAAAEARLLPGYDPGEVRRDIAVLILDKPLAAAEHAAKLTDGKLVRIGTRLVVVGRVKNGEVSADRAYKAPVERVQFPGTIHAYGGFPRTCQPGDSGGPVFVRGRERTVVAVVSRITSFTRRNVPTDGYAPITPAVREWLVRQFPDD